VKKLGEVCVCIYSIEPLGIKVHFTEESNHEQFDCSQHLKKKKEDANDVGMIENYTTECYEQRLQNNKLIINYRSS